MNPDAWWERRMRCSRAMLSETYGGGFGDLSKLEPRVAAALHPLQGEVAPTDERTTHEPETDAMSQSAIGVDPSRIQDPSFLTPMLPKKVKEKLKISAVYIT